MVRFADALRSNWTRARPAHREPAMMGKFGAALEAVLDATREG
jgi:hypothetical protein